MPLVLKIRSSEPFHEGVLIHANTCANPKVLSEGVQLRQRFFYGFLVGREIENANKYHYKRAMRNAI